MKGFRAAVGQLDTTVRRTAVRCYAPTPFTASL